MNIATWIAIATASMQLILFVIAIVLFAWKIPTKDDMNNKLNDINNNINSRLLEQSNRLSELSNRLDSLNQSFIEHLTHHSKDNP